MEYNSNLLIIFLKYPEPGKVKTRLAESIGESNAANVYRLMVEIIFKNTSSQNYRRIIFYTPANKIREIRTWLGEEIELHSQRGKDLGERLLNAFRYAFQQKKAQKVIVIGTDSPHINARLIEKAFLKLEHYECVVGPAYDGGYYLIGLKDFYPQVFKNISWSTDKVLAQTKRILRKSGLSYFLLDRGYDIDEASDLKFLEGK